MLALNDEEGNTGLLSAKDFIQLNGDTAGLIETNVAIEDVKTSSKPNLVKK